MRMQSRSAAMLLVGVLGCNAEQTTTETAERIESPEWKDTITTKDVGADVTFSTAKECGECHPSHMEEWEQSMHAYAAHSPVFDAMAQKALGIPLVRLVPFVPVVIHQSVRFKVKMDRLLEKVVQKYREIQCLVKSVTRRSITPILLGIYL